MAWYYAFCMHVRRDDIWMGWDGDNGMTTAPFLFWFRMRCSFLVGSLHLARPLLAKHLLRRRLHSFGYLWLGSFLLVWVLGFLLVGNMDTDRCNESPHLFFGSSVIVLQFGMVLLRRFGVTQHVLFSKSSIV
jgi:hypothetical protein